jgi:hypothetical protein
LITRGTSELALELTEAGILPVAIHNGELADIEALFGGFHRSNRRVTLFAKLRDYIAALRNAGIRDG